MKKSLSIRARKLVFRRAVRRNKKGSASTESKHPMAPDRNGLLVIPLHDSDQVQEHGSADRAASLCDQPAEYARGWIHGFYGCVYDDRASYGDKSQLCASASSRDMTDEALRHYALGYKDGRIVKLSTMPSYHKPPSFER
jgi:hypothetical protein